jgi:hypothetical protein
MHEQRHRQGRQLSPQISNAATVYEVSKVLFSTAPQTGFFEFSYQALDTYSDAGSLT